MKAFILTFAIVFFVILGKSQIYLTGDVTEPLILFDTVYLIGNVHVTGSGTLNFQSGTKIISQGYFRITASGTGKITAIGSQYDSIVFTVADTTGFSNFNSTSGSWAGIALIDQDATADSSIFEYCSFSYAKGFQNQSIHSGGAMNIYNAQKTRISRCRFYHNFSDAGGGAAFLINANLIEKSVFANNYAFGSGGGIKLHSGIIDSCHFVNNQAEVGGAVYCFAGYITNSTIENNFSNSHGGGVYFIHGVFENSLIKDNQSNMGGGGCYANGMCQIKNCQFINNSSGDGGGLASYPFFSDMVTVIDCLFENNTAQAGGGASAQYNTSFNNCAFTGNTATVGPGGGLDIYNCQVSNCSFTGNSCQIGGGGISSVVSDISNCILTNNNAQNGGGISAVDSNVDSCEISYNSANGIGGGIHVFSETVYRNCIISHNTSIGDGGGVYIELSGPILENCIIDSNHSNANGGGVAFEDGGIIKNCLIINNSADLKGGGVYAKGIYNINGEVINSTICKNTTSSTTNNAGGIYSQNEGDFFNNVIWGNSSSQVFVTGTNCSFSYCAVEDASSVSWGGAATFEILDLSSENLSSAGPNFTDPIDNDFTLLNSSVLINSGNPDTSNLSLPNYDLAGLPRICADTVDIGAYENQLETIVHNLSLNGFVIHPNPTISVINIVMNSSSGNYQGTIMNSFGQKIMTIGIIEKENRVDLA